MPTECERSAASPSEETTEQEPKERQTPKDMDTGDKMDGKDLNGEMSTSQTSTTSSNGHNGSNSNTSNGGGKKTSLISPDPTAYVAKARVTRPTPPPPSYNPMQFVQVKPCNLYQTAQQQLKKAEEVKKIKEIKKEEPEDWQNNLDNWKSSRRKRVEHIIDRVVEVKKLELEEHDRSRRKSKTFSEMIEERGERGLRGRPKLASLAVYNEDESNDLSDLGIGTSSASGKSSISEDYDNNSVMSDNAELDKAIFEHSRKHSTLRDYISSPGYDTSSSTAPGSSPDPCEYTYEGAIQDYKQRISRAAAGGAANYTLQIHQKNNNHNNNNSSNRKVSLSNKSKECIAEQINNGSTETYPTRRGNKIEDRLISFEVTSPSDSQEGMEKAKVDVPKIDISKRKEIFEAQNANSEPKSVANGGDVPRVVLRDRFVANTTGAGNSDAQESVKKEVKRLSGDITSIRDRLQSLEHQQNLVSPANGNVRQTSAKAVDIPVPPLKERLSSLQNAVTKEEVKKEPVVLVDARQLEIMKNEEEIAKKRLQMMEKPSVVTKTVPAEVDRDDSGIHTSDDIESEERNAAVLQQEQEQEQQLNAAIAALALEEQQLEKAANAVNKIEEEFAELSHTTAPLPATNDQQCDMEFSINEALELALEAIDTETKNARNDEVETPKDDKCTGKIEKNQIQNQNQIEKPNERKSKIPKSFEVVERKELKQQQQQQMKLPIALASKTKICQEPIYENIPPTTKKTLISTATVTSSPESAAAAVIIPNINANINATIYNNNCNNNKNSNNNNNCSKISKTTNSSNSVEPINAFANTTTATTATTIAVNSTATATPKSKTEIIPLITKVKPPLVATTETAVTTVTLPHPVQQHSIKSEEEPEPYYQVPKSSEPYYDAPKHLRPIPVYENIDIFYNGLDSSTLSGGAGAFKMEPPKEKPPPPPTESPPLFDEVASSVDNADTWSSDNTYETISTRLTQNGVTVEHPSPPIKRMNSTKRIKKELRNKRSSFLGIEGCLDDDESYLELTVAPPPDMAQLLQEERRLEKQLYLKAGLCDSSDTGESRDSGVSENHSRQSSEHYTNSSEENDSHPESPHGLKQTEIIYQNEKLSLTAAQTPLLQTVKGNSAESWRESATAAAAATQSLTEATATANAKMLSIEEKIREQEEVLRVERELLQLEQEELKRQRENLLLRENMARRELQHGAKMLMSANRHSLQDLNGVAMPASANSGYQALPHPLAQQPSQQIYANVPNLPHQYYQGDSEYRKSMSDLNEFSKRLMLPSTPPTKPMRAMHVATNGTDEFAARQVHSQQYGGSLVKIATPTAAPRSHIYSNYQHQSVQNLANVPTVVVNSSYASGVPTNNGHAHPHAHPHAHHSNMSRNTLHALSATPKPKYTDGWVQVQNPKTYDTNLANDPAWLSAYQQKRKSMPDAYHAYNNHNNHWLVQEAEQRRIAEQQRRPISTGSTPVHQQNGNGLSAAKRATPLNGGLANGNGKPLPDAIIQTLTERVQSKGIGERKRFDNYNNNINSNNNNNTEKSPLHAIAYQQHQLQVPTIPLAHRHDKNELNAKGLSTLPPTAANTNTSTLSAAAPAAVPNTTHDKVLSVSGKKKCSHCGDELGRGAAMIIESLLLFYHINCFKCCVCRVQLGDGLNGTDVRVRNHKLHCQNCYSSDDGIKFSCV